MGWKEFLKKYRYWIVIILFGLIIFPKPCGYTSGFFAIKHTSEKCNCYGLEISYTPGPDAGNAVFCFGICGKCSTTCQMMINTTGNWTSVPCD